MRRTNRLVRLFTRIFSREGEAPAEPDSAARETTTARLEPPEIQTREKEGWRPDRRGTVIVIVLALLGMLVFLGFFVLGFTGEANQALTYFANAAVPKVVTPGSDPFFDQILRQIIIGPAFFEKQSALWGGTHSLLPTMFGRDLSPFNGPGINLVWDGGTKQAAVDQDFNGTPDAGSNQNLLWMNLSPAAQLNPPFLLDLANFPASGVMYPDLDTNTTYPDINSAFLSYDALVPSGTANPVRVIIPSFHRPQILRTRPLAGVQIPPSKWYTDPSTMAYVLHPHVEHKAIDNYGNGNPTSQWRFVTAAHPDTSGIGTPLSPFPIPGDGANPAPQEGVWTCNSANPFNPAAPPAISYDVDVDADGINDAFYMDFGFPLMEDSAGNQFVALGVVKIVDADSLYNLNVHGNRAGHVDLPVPSSFGGLNTFLSRSDQGLSASEVNPEWALNARVLANTGAPPPYYVSPDVPSTWTDTDLQTALQQHCLFFRLSNPSTTNLPTDNHQSDPLAMPAVPINVELANMEWWNILDGRPQLSAGSPPAVAGSSFPGRWGENVSRLDVAVNNLVSGGAVHAGLDTGTPAYPIPDPFPLPGTSNSDDNNNQLEGGVYSDEQNLTHIPFGMPADYFSAGYWITGPPPPPLSQGKFRQLFAQGNEKYPQFSQFWVNPTQWSSFFGGALMIIGGPKSLIDEPDETVSEPAEAAKQPNDNIFGPSENNLQLSAADFAALGNPARSASLAPFNFVSSSRAAEIRKRFTSMSWDLKSFGKEYLGTTTGITQGNYDSRRQWEFTDTSGAAGTGPFRFPPNFGSLTPGAQNYPIRAELVNAGSPPGLLQVLANPQQVGTAGTTVLPQRPISINALAEVMTLTNSSGQSYNSYRFRPLTPHPSTTTSTFAKTPIWDSSFGGSNSATGRPFTIDRPEQLTAGNLAQQEWLARYDRQRLARDIYTLLYLTGGGGDTPPTGFDYTQDNSVPGGGGPRPLYNDDQLQEMAQFAVNVVDALDPDSNITVFEYDKNLNNGWNLDDNPYDAAGDAVAPYNLLNLNDRGVVYGVERQQLCFNEAMVAYSQQAVDTSAGMMPPPAWDHPDTDWDDKKQWAFFFAELENVGPSDVTFLSEQWQIAVKQSPIMAAPSTLYGSNPAYPASGTSGEMRLIFTTTQPNVTAGSKLTIGGMSGSTNGVDYTTFNPDPSSNPRPSFMVVNPNDKDATYKMTDYDHFFPIAPRAAFTTPNTATPYAIPAALGSTLWLDLISTSQATNYWVVPPFSTTNTVADGTPAAPTGIAPGSALLQFNDPLHGILPNSGPIVLRLEIRRRADPNRAPILPADAAQVNEANDNPWIVVDHMDVPVGVLALQKKGNDNDLSVQVQGQLGGIYTPSVNTAYSTAGYYGYSNPGGSAPSVSTERSQPLYHDYTLNPFNATSTDPTKPSGPFVASASTMYNRNGGVKTLLAPLWQGNSLGQDNDAAGYNPGTLPTAPPAQPVTVTPTPIAAHSLYQPHQDRDFTSVGELLNIPLYGPYGPSTPTSLANSYSSGSSASISSGVTHCMASRTLEGPAPTQILTANPPNYTPELLVGVDFVPNDPGASLMHFNGYGTAGYRFFHPEGAKASDPNPAATNDPTENRWFRLLGLVDVPTRSHRGLDPNLPPDQVAAGALSPGPAGFYRTPGKINLNTVRYPDLLAGLVDDPNVYYMQFTTTPIAANFSNSLTVPFLLPDSVEGAARDWWLQFMTARDGVDPLPVANGGTGLTLPGMPKSAPGVSPPTGSHPFRGLGFSAYTGGVDGSLDVNGYNGDLESNILRTLPLDPVASPATNPDSRRRLFELGTTAEHTGNNVNVPQMLDYTVKHRLLSKTLGNTTTRSNVFFVWIQVDFFQAKDVGPSMTPATNGVVRVGARLASSPGYRSFFVIDRSQALPLMAPQYLPSKDPATSYLSLSMDQTFPYQSLIVHRQRIQ